MMRIFNSFQIVAMFVAWPFLISWLTTKPFEYSQVAFIAACGLYVVAFGFMVAAMAHFMKSDNW